MTLYEYNILDEEKQYRIVMDKGVHVGQRMEGEVYFILYQLFSFYVEISYHPGYRVIMHLRSFNFTRTARIRPYLDKINLQKLLIGKAIDLLS